MPKFELTKNPPKTTKNAKKNKYAIAIVKGNKDNKNYNKFLVLDDEIKNKGIHRIEIDDDVCFQILPNVDKNKRDIFYLAGSSGSGKSYVARTIADNYHKMYPDRKIYIISKLDEDDTLDGMKAPFHRLKYEKLVEFPIDINEFSHSLVIFDDYDTITGKVGKAVHALIEDIAIMGRKHSDKQGCITMLCLTHYITNYKKTRLLLNEANYFVVYPQATSSHALTYLLKKHLGFEKKDIKKLKRMGRWVCFHKSYPQYLLSSQYAQILHQED